MPVGHTYAESGQDGSAVRRLPWNSRKALRNMVKPL